MRRSSLLAAVLGVLALAALTAGSAARATPAANVGVVQPVSLGGDVWWNFDFVSTGNTADVDWPVDVIFWGNASISKVYSRLGWIWTGSNVYEQVNDGAGAVWVASGGRKNTLCTDTHLRLYADGDGSLWNPVLGKYVIGTSHLDINECSRTPSYGFNETAETNIANRWASRWPSDQIVRNATLFPDGLTPTSILANAANGLFSPNHTYQNNGLPTLIRVP